MFEKPPNVGKRWTDEEKTRALQLWNDGNNYDIIASDLQRTEYAIFCFFRNIAVEKILNGEDFEEVIEWSKISPKEVEIILEKKKVEKDKKKKEKNQEMTTKELLLQVIRRLKNLENLIQSNGSTA